MKALEILRTGPLATVQDLGRPGLAHLGVTVSGALDPDALRLANRLVGNEESAAGLEVTMGGLVFRPTATVYVALTGAPVVARIVDPTEDRGAGRQVGLRTPFPVRPHERLELDAPPSGVRTWLAVRGGIDVAPVLGSRATDTLSGLGPPRLEPGTLLPVGEAITGDPLVDLAPLPAPGPEPAELAVVPGPRDDWFEPESLALLGSELWTVTAHADRIGVRLDGPDLRRLPHLAAKELPSEPMVLGALQVPPEGRPILFLADHPVTGGYPVIAVARRADLARAASARPGDILRFRVVDVRAARS